MRKIAQFFITVAMLIGTMTAYAQRIVPEKNIRKAPAANYVLKSNANREYSDVLASSLGGTTTTTIIVPIDSTRNDTFPSGTTISTIINSLIKSDSFYVMNSNFNLGYNKMRYLEQFSNGYANMDYNTLRFHLTGRLRLDVKSFSVGSGEPTPRGTINAPTYEKTGEPIFGDIYMDVDKGWIYLYENPAATGYPHGTLVNTWTLIYAKEFPLPVFYNDTPTIDLNGLAVGQQINVTAAVQPNSLDSTHLAPLGVGWGDLNTDITNAIVDGNIPDGTAAGQLPYWDGSAWIPGAEIGKVETLVADTQTPRLGISIDNTSPNLPKIGLDIYNLPDYNIPSGDNGLITYFPIVHAGTPTNAKVTLHDLRESIANPAANGLRIDNDSIKIGGAITENTRITNSGVNTVEFMGLKGMRMHNDYTSIIGKPTTSSYATLDTAFHEQLRINGTATGHNATGIGFMQPLPKGTWHMRQQLRAGALEFLTVGNYTRVADSTTINLYPELRLISGVMDSANVFQRPGVGIEMGRIRMYKHMGVNPGLPINNPNAAGVISIRSVITERNNATGALSADLRFGVMKNNTTTLDNGTIEAGKFDQERDFYLSKYTTATAVPITAVAQLVVDATGKVGTQALSAGVSADNWGTQTVATATTLAGNGTAASPLTIASQGATNGQFLAWNGTSYAPTSIGQLLSTLRTFIGSTSGAAQAAAINGGLISGDWYIWDDNISATPNTPQQVQIP